MKTHELADALMHLAEALKAGQNRELKDWTALVSSAGRNGVDSADVALSLSSLTALSRITKKQWRGVISELRLPVPIKNTDSVRDLVGRLLRYLEEHPDAERKLRTESAQKSKKASPELMKALSILLGGGEDEAADSEGNR